MPRLFFPRPPPISSAAPAGMAKTKPSLSCSETCLDNELNAPPRTFFPIQSSRSIVSALQHVNLVRQRGNPGFYSYRLDLPRLRGRIAILFPQRERARVRVYCRAARWPGFVVPALQHVGWQYLLCRKWGRVLHL